MDPARITQCLETQREGPAGRIVTYKLRKGGAEVVGLNVVWQDMDINRESTTGLMSDDGEAVVAIIAAEMVTVGDPDTVIAVSNGDTIIDADGLEWIVKAKRKLANAYWRVNIMSGEPVERTSRGYRNV